MRKFINYEKYAKTVLAENSFFEFIVNTHFSYESLCVTGLFSSIMRDLSNNSSESPKWIVLDGDIDPMWIESLNTVMDDNKVKKQ